MIHTNRRLAMLLLAVATVVGALLLLLDTPLWLFYLAPLLTVPIVLIALNRGDLGRSGGMRNRTKRALERPDRQQPVRTG
jgi:hypothetical protein